MTLTLFSISVYAAEPKHQTLDQVQIEKMDKRMDTRKTVQKKFHNQNEYAKTRRAPKHDGHTKHPSNAYPQRMPYAQNDRIIPGAISIRQPGYRYFKRGWELAYLYDRASFYDSYGYHYGYFNRHGYYFDGIFYRYDRDYTFRDRARGKGLFDNRYYMPYDAVYYGFSRGRR